MGQSVVLKCKGLYTFPNSLSEIPDGALIEASNVVIDRESVISPRRGFKLFGDSMGAASPANSNRAKQLLEYKGRIVRHYASSLDVDTTGAGSFLTLSATIREVESGLRIKGIEANGNLYLTTSTGVDKVSAASAAGLATAVITSAGGVKALDIDVAQSTSIAGFLEPDSAVAYRIVWGLKDANQNLILGSPSPRTIVRNATIDTKKADLTFAIPQGVTTSHFHQIYRTTIVTPSTVDPGDEMQLVYEANPTSAEITAGVVVVEDLTPEDFLGAFLYTNPNSGEGILQANEPPPLCKDIALFKGSAFFANTATQHRKIVALLGTVDLVAGVSQFIIKNSTTTETYTFNAAENISTLTAQLFTASTPAQNVDDTAKSLVRVINRQSSGLVYAFYLSGDVENDLPGKILLEARDVGQEQFRLLVENEDNTGDSFNPALPDVSSTFSETSDNEVAPNRVFYSKTQQPEAVPLVNYTDIGPRDKKILRILSLRDSLFVLKEDGVYRISGDSPRNFQVTLFDNSTTCRAPDTAAILNNQIYMLSDQGVATISDTGISIVSRPIENLLLPLMSSSYTNFTTASFAVGYESDRAYLVWTVSKPSDTVATQCFRFNVFTSTWTTWDMTKVSGVVNSENARLYLGASDIYHIEEERKDYGRLDHADRESEVTIPLSSLDGTTIALGSLFGIEVGDVLVQTQYLTLAQFNRLLKRLDSDNGVADSDYFATLEALPSENLATKLSLLATKLSADTSISDNDYVSSGSSVFATIQSDFNVIVDKLNADNGVIFGTYKRSTGTVEWEVGVQSTDSRLNFVVLDFTVPFTSGGVTVYKKISSSIVWAPNHFGDPSMTKQVRESTILFENNAFTKAIAAYATDLSPAFEEIPFNGEGNGTWGGFVFGNGSWGGEGTSKPFRTYIPRQKQRCRYINGRYEHAASFEQYAIFGISYTFEPVSTRGYR